MLTLEDSVAFRVHEGQTCNHAPTKIEIEHGTDVLLRSIVGEPNSRFLSLEERETHPPTLVAGALAAAAQSASLGSDLFGVVAGFR